MYRFHFYYQTMRILVELRGPFPTDASFDVADNPYDRRAYEGLAQAFGIDPKNESMFRVHGPNSGAGRNYVYIHGSGYTPAYPSGEAAKFVRGHHSFTKATSNSTLHIDFNKQDQIGPDDWTKLIPDKTDGLTLEGVQRLNDSIRTYVWAVLGAQGQTRSVILGSDSTRFDAQKQFGADVTDAINAPVDLPAAIARYQDSLQYAGSQVDFAYGQGLYMSPSIMVLDIARGVAGYINKILTSDSISELGHQPGVNVTATPPQDPTPADDFSGKINPPHEALPTSEVGAPSSTPLPPKAGDDGHSDDKIAIVLLATATFAGLLYAFRGRIM
jgi:hypothetical protein